MKARAIFLSISVALLIQAAGSLSKAGSVPPVRTYALSSENATATFEIWIQEHFAAPVGLWVCPEAQIYDDQGTCLAEFRSNKRWHKLFATAEQSGGRVVISNSVDRSWTRRWTRYRRDLIRGFDLPGKASVNGEPAADWPWLAAGAYHLHPHRRTVWINAFDGNSAGFEQIELFRCHRTSRLIRCRNKLGDAMRYRPRA